MIKDLIFYFIIDIRKFKISRMESKLRKKEIKLEEKRKLYRNYLLKTKIMIDNRKEGK